MLDSSYRILADITFHYNEKRLKYLFEVIRAFSEYPVELLDIVVATNVINQDKLDRIKSLCAPLLEGHPARPSGKKHLSIESYPDLANPWYLPWCHKHLISGKFLDPDIAFTHYIHVEDDILLSFDNFCYFDRYRKLLRDYRLIPSFQRVEYNFNDNRLYLVDQISILDFTSRKKIDVGDLSFVNPDYPHNAMFILDRDLALEYIDSRSFDQERSIDVRPNWGLCERSSMGLCFENPPDGFFHRYVIPVNTETLRTPCWSWVYHIAEKYTTNPRVRFGKIQPDHLFSSDLGVINWSPPTKLDNLMWHFRRLWKRVWYGPPATSGNELVPSGLCPICGLNDKECGTCPRQNCPRMT